MAKQTTLQDIGDRLFTGVNASALYKSQQEAPDVSNYNYDNIDILAYDAGTTDMNDFNEQYTTSLFGTVSGATETPAAAVETLLNDALICVRIDDGARLLDILNILKNDYQIQYPADAEFGELFRDTLWNRVNDDEFRIAGSRADAVELMSYFHQNGSM